MKLVEFVDAIDATIRRIRTTIFRLNRAPYGGGSLKERLLSVVEDARPALGFTAHAEFSGPLDQAVSDDLADHVVAVAREALSNIARHAGAASVRLRVTLADGVLSVDAIDDGCGIGEPTRSSGLANLERRAREHAEVSAPWRPPPDRRPAAMGPAPTCDWHRGRPFRLPLTGPGLPPAPVAGLSRARSSAPTG